MTIEYLCQQQHFKQEINAFKSQEMQLASQENLVKCHHVYYFAVSLSLIKMNV